MIGAVTFIRVLLLMAGVEPNPGPGNQTFVFRYQYLLIEVGTGVMQKLFDDVIGTDFGTYLAANVTAANKFQWLIGSGKITKAQQNYLPPINTKPKSFTFDITLLSCLLRNVCGLRHFNDAVWTNPAPADHSLEADVTRLRECRNNVAHMRTVSILDTDLAVKWIELTEILKRLNSCHGNGVTDLTSKIDQAEHMDIDDNLRKQYDTIVDQWKEMERLYDHGIGELQQGQTDIKHDQSEIKQGQSELKQGHSEIKQGQSEIKQGQSDIQDAQSELKQGQSEIKQGQSEIKQGQSELKQGHSEIKQGQSEIKQGQSDIQDAQSELKQGQSEIKQGQSEIKQGQSEIKQGQSEIKQGQSDIQDAQSELKQGQTEIKQGHSEIKQGQSDIKDDQSEIKQGQSDIQDAQYELKQGQTEIKQGQSDIQDAQSELKQGQSDIQDAQSELKQGQSGIQDDQSEIKQGQSDIQDAQYELKQGQTEIKQGQSDIQDAQSELKQGQTEIKQGQSDIKDDQSEIKQDQSEIKQGQSEIKQGQSEIKQDQSEIKQGQSDIKDDLSELKRGQSEIKQGLLAQGQSKLQKDAQKDRENQEKTVQAIRDTKQAAKLENEKDLKNRLMKRYQEDCCSLPVLPLCGDDEEEVDLLSIYQPPSLFHVPYHRHEGREQYPISSYKEIFSKKDHCFSNIFITGDAGVGKSSLCKCMALLWCKSQCNEKVDDEVTQTNIEFMGRFDFIFFVSLRDTDTTDVITMIIEQVYTERECVGKMNELSELVENTLNEHVCLIILDGLDEWSPKTSRKKSYVLPDKEITDKCCFLITCRPYKIETVRLPPKDLDRQVQIRGISGDSKTRYVEEIVARCNKANDENRSPNDFVREVKMCGLDDQLCVPIVGSQLVAIWFDNKLTDMSRALIYSNILEMLFERAEMRCKNKHTKRRIHSPSEPLCSGKLPNTLTDLVYFNSHVDLLAKICFLSFRSLFKFDNCASVLVFSRKQLMSEPYLFSDEEMDSLCKIGILSRNKVIGRLGKQEQKLSFLHKSYLEYFAALFVASFDSSNAFDNVVKEWTTLNDIVQFQIFFIFLSGISCEKVSFLFEDIYMRISDDLAFNRRDFLFTKQLESLQIIITNCFKQVSRSSNPNFSLKLEDFIFRSSNFDGIDLLSGDNESNTELRIDVHSQKQLFLLNRTCVHFLHSVHGEYFVEFDQIRNLQILQVGVLTSTVYVYDVQFNECMLQNQSTLHTLCIMGCLCLEQFILIPELPVKSIQHLTSLYLISVIMRHNDLHNLVKLLSDNVLFENINLSNVTCQDHWFDDSDCTFTLNLQQHTKLTLIELCSGNILCNNVNISSLKSMTLETSRNRIVSCYTDLFNCIKCSQLEQLNVSFASSLDYNTDKTLTCTVKTLSHIKSLILTGIELPDDVFLQLHPEVTQVNVLLNEVTMSPQCFHYFIESFVNNKSVIKVKLTSCAITSVDGETHGYLSFEESVDYMSEYLTSIATVNITRKDEYSFEFETRSCQ